MYTSAKACTVPDVLSGSPPKFNLLFIGQLPTFPENFMQIHLKIFTARAMLALQALY